MRFIRFRKNSQRDKNLRLLYFLGGLLALANALPVYIQSNFLGQIFSVSLVSVSFIVANFLAIIAILFFPKLIGKIGNIASTESMTVVFILSLLGMSLSASPILIFIFFIFASLSANLLWINLDLLIESFSKDSSTGLTRTIYFTAINLSYIIAPSLSSYIINRGGYYLVFLIAAIVLIPFLVIFLKKSVALGDTVHNSIRKIRPALFKMKTDANLRGVFLIATLLNLFYSSAVVYIPLYLHKNLGFAWSDLGIMFSIMLLPFLIFEIPSGWLADKYWGEKEMMNTGLAIIAFSLIMFFLIDSHNPWLWGSLLFLSRIGASLVEAMKETYFFKMVDAKDLGLINLFRTSGPWGYLAGTTLALLVVHFYSLPYVFLAAAILMIAGFFPVYKLHDSL